MSERTWHKGPPPHVGWWEASADHSTGMWRWWNGECWSVFCTEHESAKEAGIDGGMPTGLDSPSIEWTNYYPENARVPRAATRRSA